MAKHYRVVERVSPTLTDFEKEISELIEKEGWIPLGRIRIDEFEGGFTYRQTLWRSSAVPKEDWK